LQLEILGEALKNLRNVDPETAARIPDAHRIIGLRDVLAHAYAVINDSVVAGFPTCWRWWKASCLPATERSAGRADGGLMEACLR
jgi:hypothetical protein